MIFVSSAKENFIFNSSMDFSIVGSFCFFTVMVDAQLPSQVSIWAVEIRVVGNQEALPFSWSALLPTCLWSRCPCASQEPAGRHMGVLCFTQACWRKPGV